VILECFKKYCQEVQDKGTACDISRAANNLHVRVNELVQTKGTSNAPNNIDTRFTRALVSFEGIKNVIGGLLFKGL